MEKSKPLYLTSKYAVSKLFSSLFLGGTDA